MRKQFIFFLTVSSLLLPLKSFGTFPVFDATNNVLATLQKTMDSAFQTVQKANMATLIQQSKEDFAKQVKIYDECVKQYEESVKIYNQAITTYKWIDTNVGNARNLKSFLSCGVKFNKSWWLWICSNMRTGITTNLYFFFFHTSGKCRIPHINRPTL